MPRPHDPNGAGSKTSSPDGYPSLSTFMASDPDGTALIYKRFNRLSARNLLYLQSELAELQDQLDQYDEEDRGQPCARNWEHFKERGHIQTGRIQLVKQIREIMLEYSE